VSLAQGPHIGHFVAGFSPTKNCVATVIMEVSGVSLIPVDHELCRLLLTFHVAFIFPDACRDAHRDSRTSSSTCCVAASEEACEPRGCRPFALGTAFTCLEAKRKAWRSIRQQVIDAVYGDDHRHTATLDFARACRDCNFVLHSGAALEVGFRQEATRKGSIAQRGNQAIEHPSTANGTTVDEANSMGCRRSSAHAPTHHILPAVAANP
jgi:hypothetical protein